MKKARDVLFDFLHHSFLLGLIIFCLLYFIVGDRFASFTELVKKFIPLAIFLIFFLIRLKYSREDFKKRKRETSLDEIIIHLTKLDKIKDLVTISFSSFTILAISFIDRSVDASDVLQAIIAFLTLLFWHIALFKKGENVDEVIHITYFDKIKDGVITFLLPIIIISVALIGKDVSIVDFLQASVPFAIMYLWHKVLFSGN